MTIECPRCKKENDIGEAKIEDAFCYNCFGSLRDVTATVEHNKREIEKLKYGNQKDQTTKAVGAAE